MSLLKTGLPEWVPSELLDRAKRLLRDIMGNYVATESSPVAPVVTHELLVLAQEAVEEAVAAAPAPKPNLRAQVHLLVCGCWRMRGVRRPLRWEMRGCARASGYRRR